MDEAGAVRCELPTKDLIKGWAILTGASSRNNIRPLELTAALAPQFNVHRQ